MPGPVRSERLEKLNSGGSEMPLRRVLALDAAETFVEVEGEGPPVILIHGVGLDRAMWGPVAERLAARFTVMRYDMAGHGLSGRAGEPVGLGTFVRQLSQLAEALGLERFALVGFSMGALVARVFAQEQPERLTYLALLGSVFERSPEAQAAVEARLAQAEAEGPASIVGAALDRWLTPAFRAAHPETVQAVRRRLEANDPAGFLPAYRVFAEADAGPGDRLKRIACPTLVATGGLDRGSTPAMTRALAAAIPGARAEVLEGLAHLFPLEAPERTAALLLAFLGER